MNILILHMRYAPDATGTGPLVTQLAQDLSAKGERVSVITSVPHYGRQGVPEGFRQGLLSVTLEDGVWVWRTAAFPHWSGQVLGRAIDYLLYTLLSLWAGLQVEKPDVILAIAPPITVGPLGWLISRLRAARLIYNAQDIWPDGLIQMERLNNPLLIKIFRAMEAWIYRVVDRITVVSEGMRRNLRGKGVPGEKIEVIPNWVDLAAIKPVPRDNSFRQEHGLEEQFIVLFAGNIGYAAGLDVLLEAAEFCRSSKDVLFLLVGEGSAKEALVETVHRIGLANVMFLPTQPEARLSEMLGVADLSLVTLRPGMGGLSVPSKTYAYMASARPILAAVPLDSAIREVIETADCGRTVPPDDPRVLAEAILEMKSLGPELDEMGVRGRRYAEAHYGREVAVDQYLRLLRHEARVVNQ